MGEQTVNRIKLFVLSTLVLGGATLFQGCLSGFWEGFFNDGWPTDNQMINTAIDVLNEELFG